MSFFNVILNSCSSNDNTFIITTVYMHQLDEALFAEIAEIICKNVFPIIFTKIKGTSKQDEHIHTNKHTHTYTHTHRHTHTDRQPRYLRNPTITIHLVNEND